MKTKLLCSGIGLFLLVVAAADAQTLTSHLNGNWDDGNTWGGGVPDSGSNVIVNDTVGIPSRTCACRNLTINARGAIIGPGTLTIYGNIINNGAISQNPAQRQFLDIAIMGNITNNGIWRPEFTYLTGTQRQDISNAVGRPFEGDQFYNSDTAGVRATSALTFRTAVTFNFGTGLPIRPVLDMQNNALTIDGANSGSIVDASIINASDITCINDGWLDLLSCSGNLNLHQKVAVGTYVTFIGNITITDTLRTSNNASRTLTINGNVTNLGIVDGNIALNITGNIANRGIWRPDGGTYLIGTQRQELSQAAGTAFEGPFINSDTAGVKATSALTFRTGVNFSFGIGSIRPVLDMQNNALTIDGADKTTMEYLQSGYIQSATIINARDITCINDALLDMSSCSGNINLHQKVGVGGDVTFIGIVTITDTLRTWKNASRALTINGNVTNLGIVDGNIELDVTGNITNSGSWSATTYLLTGGTNRKIKGRFDGPVTFQQTGSPAAGIVQVDGVLDNRNIMTVWGVTLEVPNGSALYNYSSLNMYGGSISNKGKISYPFKVTTSQNYNFFAGSATIPSSSGLDSLIFEHYGYQVLPTFANACKSRWNIIPRPSTIQATATSLTFYYHHDELGSNVESLLQVYQSSDAAAWKTVSTGSNITRDTSGNSVTVTDVPLYGNYGLASSVPVYTNPTESIIPASYALMQNYPNPFNPSTTIRFDLPKSTVVSLKIFNSLGQEIAVLVNERMEAGMYSVRWNASVASGVYFYCLQAGEFSQTRKLVVVK